MMRRLVVVPAAAVGLLLLVAGPVAANHTHVMGLGNGRCVLLAAKGGEEDVAAAALCVNGIVND